MIKKILSFGSAHKVFSGFIIIVLVIGIYFWHKAATNTSAETRYVLTTVQKGTLISSISGSGQVSVSDQLDIKPKTSGDVVYTIPTSKLGKTVQAGTLLVQLDTTDAQKTVRNAQINLENSQIALSKLQINQQNDIPSIQNSITSAQNNLNQTYLSSFNEVSGSFLDLPTINNDIRGVLYDYKAGSTGQVNTGAYQNLVDNNTLPTLLSTINQAGLDYLTASQKYNQAFTDYNNADGNSTTTQAASLVSETLDATQAMIQATKDEQNMLSMVVTSLQQNSRTVPSVITSYQTQIATDLNKLNSHASSLTSLNNSIFTGQQALSDAQRNLTNTQQSDPLNLASQQNSLKQAQASLDDAKETLDDCYVRAPFTGILAKVSVNIHDSASSGAAVATMITPQQVAVLSLNEVDAAKVNVGNKATLTFDAIPDLTISGQLLQLDTIGAVSQGVVSYSLKIGFDTQDSRVKPGMSVSANIITDVKNDVLLVPNSAIKTTSGNSYVQVVDASSIPSANTISGGTTTAVAGVLLSVPPRQQQVQTGTTNNTETEITSGLNEGDTVVSRTITTAKTSTTSTSSTTRSIFSTGSTGGAVRATSGGIPRGN